MHWFFVVLLGLLGLITLMLAFIGALYLTRGTPVHRVRAPGDADGVPGVDDPLFCDSIALLTHTALRAGHEVAVFGCGDETYPALWRDLRSARRSITMQMYFMDPGRMADELQAILLERAAQGVKVLLLRDAFGSGTLPDEYIEKLEAGGVNIAAFRPTRWYELHKAQHRSHIRVVVVDAQVGYTGGFGIADKWFGDGRHEDQWRDTTARFEGPAVMQLQATFVAGWAEATGTLLTGDLFFPPEGGEQTRGGVYAGCLHAAPTMGSTAAERFMALSIASAKRSLFITNAYLVPSDDFCGLLGDAVKRGVDVRLLTCNVDGDVKTTYYAGRAQYEKLLAAGVRIYEYQPAMVHAKTIVADAHWAGVGTINFDNRSMAFNDESMFMALDRTVGEKVERMFHADLEYSEEIVLEAFRKRPATDRLKERAATTVSRLL